MRPGQRWFKQWSLIALLSTWAVLALPGCGGCGGSDLTDGGGGPLDADSQRLTSEAIAGLQPLLEDPLLALPDVLSPLAAKFKAAYQKDVRNGGAKAGYAIAEAAKLASTGLQGLPPETKLAQQAYPAKTIKKHLLALNLGWVDGRVWRGTAEDGAPFRAITTLPLLETSYEGLTGQALTDLLSSINSGLTDLDAFLEAQGNVVTDADPLVFTFGGAQRKFGAVELRALRSCIKSAIAELNLVLAYHFSGATGMEDSIFKIMKVDPTKDGSIYAKADKYLPAAPYATLPVGGQARLGLFGSQTAASADLVSAALILQEARTSHAGWISRPPNEQATTYQELAAQADLLRKVVTGPVHLVVEPSAFGGRYEGTLNVPAFISGGAPTDLRTIFPQWNKKYFGGPGPEPTPGSGDLNWGGSAFGGLLTPKAPGRFWDASPVKLKDGIRDGINVFMDCVGRGWDEVDFKIQWEITPIP